MCAQAWLRSTCRSCQGMSGWLSASPRRMCCCTCSTRPSSTGSTACLHGGGGQCFHAPHSTPLLQVLVCDVAPEHVPQLPLPHVRDCVVMPWPHVVEHPDHGAQALHVLGVPAMISAMQWTAAGRTAAARGELPARVLMLL